MNLNQGAHSISKIYDLINLWHKCCFEETYPNVFVVGEAGLLELEGVLAGFTD